MRKIAVLIALATITTTAPRATAGPIENIALGLGFAGFDLQGSNNVLSGGADFRIVRNFQGTLLDFGTWDLAMQGPISFEVSTGGRIVNNIDIAFQTAVTRNNTSQPLNYVYNFDVGGQQTQVTGSVLIDGQLSLNGFGFYDLTIDYSSRQDAIESGNLINDTLEQDFDLGPINVSGNIFADALAVLVDPLFERAGRQNPLTAFSGALQLDELMNPGTDGSLLNLDGLLRDATFASAAEDSLPGQGTFAAPVPEPATLLLMAGALPLLLRRRAS